MSSYALITGANRGIGRSLATSLARRKYKLLLVARSSADLANLSTSLAAAHGIRAQSQRSGEESRRRVIYIPIIAGKYAPKDAGSPTLVYQRFAGLVR